MKRSAFVVSLFISATFCINAYAKDMVLTTLDGADLLLKDDSTWVFKGGNPINVEENFTVPVDGGKYVLISTDGTWGFVKKPVLKERELIPTDSVTGKGQATHIDVAVATSLAQKEAYSRINTKMITALKNVKIDQKKLADCVKRVEKDVDKKEEFTKGKGWNVTVAIKLDRGSILAVAECAMKDAAAPAGKAGDSTVVKKK